MDELIKKIEESIEFYNFTRGSESQAKIIKLDMTKKEIYIEFKGSFCHTCGVKDWIEDMKYIFIKNGIKSELLDIEEKSENILIGKFKIFV
ncbi:MAG: hypothetical protein QXG71_01870 [Nanopusillaceae archaeon]